MLSSSVSHGIDPKQSTRTREKNSCKVRKTWSTSKQESGRTRQLVALVSIPTRRAKCGSWVLITDLSCELGAYGVSGASVYIDVCDEGGERAVACGWVDAVTGLPLVDLRIRHDKAEEHMKIMAGEGMPGYLLCLGSVTRSCNLTSLAGAEVARMVGWE